MRIKYDSFDPKTGHFRLHWWEKPMAIYQHICACRRARPNESVIAAYRHYRWSQTLRPGDKVMAPGPNYQVSQGP